MKDGDVVEYVGKSTVPLRGWVKVQDGLPGKAAALGPVGRTILKIESGDEVWIKELQIVAPQA